MKKRTHQVYFTYRVLPCVVFANIAVSWRSSSLISLILDTIYFAIREFLDLKLIVQKRAIFGPILKAKSYDKPYQKYEVTKKQNRKCINSWNCLFTCLFIALLDVTVCDLPPLTNWIIVIHFVAQSRWWRNSSVVFWLSYGSITICVVMWVS